MALGAWWAVQEVAKQCVAARLRTHHGGPAQTLAALERALQHAADELQQQEPAAAVGGAASHEEPVESSCERRRAAVLLLLFLQALEQAIAGAAHGGGAARAAAPQAAVAFFAVNAKVTAEGPARAPAAAACLPLQHLALTSPCPSPLNCRSARPGLPECGQPWRARPRRRA